MAKRRNFTDQSAKMALKALRGDKTVPEIAAKQTLGSNTSLRSLYAQNST